MKQVYSGIGGQAVLGGIMMKNKDEYSLAVRTIDDDIVVEKHKIASESDNPKFLKWPFIRGIFAMVDSLILGTKTLNRSAELLGDDIVDEEPSKFEKWLSKVFGDKLDGIIMTIVMVLSFVFAIAVFMMLPALIGQGFKIIFKDRFTIAFIEGVVRIIIFVLYVKLISRMPDIRETFEYHGSEHKCINCIEHGLPLTVENVMISSKEHKRCGTSFLVYVMIISIFLFMFLPVGNIWEKLISRVLLIPVIAGVSYEVLRLMGKFDNSLVNILSGPGLWMQGLTTKEPNEKEIEVAIRAVEEVFDWKKFQEDNFKK